MGNLIMPHDINLLYACQFLRFGHFTTFQQNKHASLEATLVQN